MQLWLYFCSCDSQTLPHVLALCLWFWLCLWIMSHHLSLSPPPSLSLPLPSFSLPSFCVVTTSWKAPYLCQESVFIAHFFCLLPDLLSNSQEQTDSKASQCSLPPRRWSLRGCEIKFFIQLSNEWTKDIRHLDPSASICGICIRGMEINSFGHRYHETDLR